MMSEQPSERRFFSGSNLERAIIEAAGHYGLDPAQLSYSVPEKRGLASRGKVVIRVDPKSPRLAEAAPKSKGSEPATKASTPSTPSTPSKPSTTSGEVAPDEVAPAPEGEEPKVADRPASRRQSVAEQATQVVAKSPSSKSSGTAKAAEAAAERSAPKPAELEAVQARAAGSRAGTGAEPTAAPTQAKAPVPSRPPEHSDAPEGAAATPSTETGELEDLPRTTAEARRGWQRAEGKLEEAMRRWTESLLRVASLDLDIEIYMRDGEPEVHLSGADSEVAVEDGGEVLRAMQHLLPRLMLKEVGDAVPCRVDCNDFRELHEERLRSRALSAAAEALAEGNEVTLEPMHPADRRVVHLALADNELVSTESLGRGFFKRVAIRSS